MSLGLRVRAGGTTAAGLPGIMSSSAESSGAPPPGPGPAPAPGASAMPPSPHIVEAGSLPAAAAAAVAAGQQQAMALQPMLTSMLLAPAPFALGAAAGGNPLLPVLAPGTLLVPPPLPIITDATQPPPQPSPLPSQPSPPQQPSPRGGDPSPLPTTIVGALNANFPSPGGKGEEAVTILKREDGRFACPFCGHTYQMAKSTR